MNLKLNFERGSIFMEANNEMVKLSPPWQTYRNELEAMFKGDPDVTIRYFDDEKIIKLYVAKNYKAEALERILRHEVSFGNVTLKIEVVPPNEDSQDILDIFEDAFNGNSSLRGTIPVETPFGMYRYAMFNNKVVQFYNDQMDDPYGNKSMLMQDIARDIFADNLSVNYCTHPVDVTQCKNLMF